MSNSFIKATGAMAGNTEDLNDMSAGSLSVALSNQQMLHQQNTEEQKRGSENFSMSMLDMQLDQIERDVAARRAAWERDKAEWQKDHDEGVKNALEHNGEHYAIDENADGTVDYYRMIEGDEASMEKVTDKDLIEELDEKRLANPDEDYTTKAEWETVVDEAAELAKKDAQLRKIENHIDKCRKLEVDIENDKTMTVEEHAQAKEALQNAIKELEEEKISRFDKESYSGQESKNITEYKGAEKEVVLAEVGDVTGEASDFDLEGLEFSDIGSEQNNKAVSFDHMDTTSLYGHDTDVSTSNITAVSQFNAAATATAVAENIEQEFEQNQTTSATATVTYNPNIGLG